MRQVVGAFIVSIIAVAGERYARSQSPSASASASALAEQLFNQGRDLAKSNQWAEACPKFEASLRYDPVLGTRLNLATCYEHIGKLASAWGLYRESIGLARKVGDNKRGGYAQKQAIALEPRLPQLAISAPPNAPVGVLVQRDGQTVDAGALGVALYVDPGTHKVTASAPGFEAFTVSITLVEGKTETLVIPTLVAKPAAVADPSTHSATRQVGTEPQAPASRTRTYAALGLGAAGVVAIGVGLGFGAKARWSYNDATALCGDDMVCSAANFERDKQLVRDARSSATVSTVMIVSGGAAIAAGLVVYLTAPRASERATARLVPVTHKGGAGLALTGTF